MTTPEDFGFNDRAQWPDQRRVAEVECLAQECLVLECLMPDLTGVACAKILPRKRFTDDHGVRLPETIVGMGVTGAPTRPRVPACPRW